MVKIIDIDAMEILDSRGNPTVEVECVLDSGIRARAAVPSGASTGKREAIELRDGDPSRFQGRGVLKAVENVCGPLREAVVGMGVCRLTDIDRVLREVDGTPNKERMGANAILGVSQAVARAGAMASSQPLYQFLGGATACRLPVPCLNVMNGGVHARWQGSDFQEYMLVPYGATSFREALRWASEIYQQLRTVLIEAGHHVGVGDEGGFAPAVGSNTDSLDFIMKAIEATGLRPGPDVGIAIDPASSEFCENGVYNLRTEGRRCTAAEMTDYYADIVNRYPICLLEDGLSEDDWEHWPAHHEKLGQSVEIVGDDLLVTNVKYIERAIREKCCNAALIKLNQIGTVSETAEAIRMCNRAGWGAFVSHRSGETVDSFVADLSVAFGTGHIKTGAPCRGERVEKYNQFLRIERSLGAAAVFAGKSAFSRPIRF